MPVTDTFPEPEVFEPLSGVHKHTVILLHGRGGRGLDSRTRTECFSEIRRIVRFHHDNNNSSNQPSSSTPPKTTESSRPLRQKTSLEQALPDTRFVFPSACRRRATVYNRCTLRQWFDDWHLGPKPSGEDVATVDARYDEGLQTSGLGETVAYLHGLIAREVARLVGERGGGGGGGGARNVVLGGFSQGAAAALVAALLWEGGGGAAHDHNDNDDDEPLGAVVGLSAWVPYARQLMSICKPDRGEDMAHQAATGVDDLDPFDRSAAAPGNGDHVVVGSDSRDAALDWLREEIDLPRRRRLSGERPQAAKKTRTPVLLCHGLDDVNVEPGRSQEALKILSALGMGPVVRKTYAGDGHEVSGTMLADVVDFLWQTLEGSCTDG